MTKILEFDLEVSATKGWSWQKWDTNIIQVDEDWHMLSYAWKWLDEKTTHVVGLPDFPGYSKDKKNDKALVKSLWDLMNEADAVIAHNGAKFDCKMANVRFIKWGMTPPAPYKVIDTLLIAKKYFRFFGNSLDDLGEFLGLGRKLKHEGFQMWIDCDNGDERAWSLMKRYNKQDVVLLDAVYNRLRSWVTAPQKPNSNGFCPDIACGSDKLQKRGTEIRRGGVRYQRLVCTDCGQWCYGGIVKK